MSRDVHVINHPLVQHKLTLMRRKGTSTKSFRELVHEISSLLAYELTRDMPMQEIQIETPLETMTSRIIDGKKVVLASILRAGNGFLDGMLQVLPAARVGHIGLSAQFNGGAVAALRQRGRYARRVQGLRQLPPGT